MSAPEAVEFSGYLTKRSECGAVPCPRVGATGLPRARVRGAPHAPPRPNTARPAYGRRVRAWLCAAAAPTAASFLHFGGATPCGWLCGRCVGPCARLPRAILAPSTRRPPPRPPARRPRSPPPLAAPHDCTPPRRHVAEGVAAALLPAHRQQALLFQGPGRAFRAPCHSHVQPPLILTVLTCFILYLFV